MAIGRKRNTSNLFVICKIFISAAVVHTFISTRDLPETVVRLFAITCKISFDSREFFHHRVQIDQYIVFVGMLVGILYVWLGKCLDPNGRQDRTARYLRRMFPVLKYSTIAIALVTLPAFFYFVNTRFHSQNEGTAWQPYITFIPILAFLTIRNAHPVLRNFHSVAFAWLGRYSGEMYVMQNHLWLAGDQEAILRTGLFHGSEKVPGDRWRDLVLLTPLYFIACSIIGETTGTITTAFIKPSSQTETHQTSVSESTEEVEMRLLPDVELEDDGLTSEKRRPKVKVLERIRNFRPWPREVRERALVVLALMWMLNLVSRLSYHLSHN